MRITVVIGAFLPMPPAPTGAIEKVWHRLCERFAELGHEVTVLCPAADGENPEETLRGVRYRRFRRRSRTGSTRLDLVKDLLYSLETWRHLPPAAVTVTNCFWLPALLRIAGKANAGALDVHAQRFPKGQFRLYRNAERISTVSEAIAAAIREQTPAVADRVKVIPNPVDLEVFRPAGSSRRDPSARTILFTGRIHPEKGLELLARAAAVLHAKDARIRLRIVGPFEIERGGGGAPFVESLRRAAGACPIEFPGSIADPVALATELRSCDVYCYPSLAYLGEASPVAPLEAMACGAVPVVSDLPQFAGYITPERTGLVFAREAADAVEQAAAAMARVLHDPALAERLRTEGIRRAQEFSVERIAEAHLEDFAVLTARSAIRSRPPAPAGD